MQSVIRRIETLEKMARTQIRRVDKIMSYENIGCVEYINAEKRKAHYEGVLKTINVIKGARK